VNKQTVHIATDVLVIGGGSAGVAAANSAATHGADVILIEKNGFLGGMATAAYVGTICGLYPRSHRDETNYIVDGFMKDFGEELSHRSRSKPKIGQHGLKFLPYDRMSFMTLCDDILSAAKARVLFHVSLNRVHAENKRITGVEVITDKGPLGINAKSVIDTSGHTAVGYLIDEIKLIESTSYQAGAFVFGLNRIKLENEMHLNLHIIKALKMGVDSGTLADDKSWISLIPGSLKNGNALLKLSIPFDLHEGILAVSQAEQYARNKVLSTVAFLKNAVLPLAQSEISMMAPAIGIRTGPRYQGKYCLTEAEVLSCKKNENSAARGVWPIEYWKPGEPVHMTYFEEDDYYDIPADCLRCDEMENLFFAGRHISSDEPSIASARVIGTCLQMGESAGKMANAWNLANT
jgi:hypothetical protein